MAQVFSDGKTSLDKHQRDEKLFDEASNHESPLRHVHVTILGTGFSGLGMAIRLKQQGENDFMVIEKASDIGGAWRDNTYPGCACDIPSHLYSFSFALNPNWSRMYSPQPEIQNYLCDCAQRFNIIPHIQWKSTLLNAAWHEDDQRWHLTTTRGQFTTDILILGNGPLSEPSLPAIPGIEHFAGMLFHSAQWRHDYDLTDKRIAVIGTGASAIQFVPKIQPQVGSLLLFQRTPPWIVPRLDHAIPEWKRKLFRLLPLAQRLERAKIYWQRELSALGLVYKPDLLEAGKKIARHYLEAQISDPVLRAKLTPHYEMGCKRILVSDDFYPALTHSNVQVISEKIREIRPHSVVTEDGKEHKVDAIICGTGFHVTDMPLSEHIYGREGRLLADIWHNSPQAYLGATVAGFPNMFLLIGPNTGLGHNSMVYMIESQISYILDCLLTMKRKKLQSVEVRPEVQEAFNTQVQQRMQKTVWNSGCASWYLDATGRNTSIWPGFTFEFRHRTRRFDGQHYRFLPRQAPVRI